MTLVLVPGFMADAGLWDDVAARLAPFGPLYRADLSCGTSIADMAARVLADAPAGPFVAVGFSMGGYVAREMARQSPERVRALALIATSARPDTEERARQRSMAARGPARAFRGLSRMAIASSLHPGRADDAVLGGRIREMSLRLGGEVMARQSGVARDGDLDRLDQVRVPVLIVAAAQDRLRSLEEARELRDGLPDARLLIVDDSGHMIPFEQPAALADVLAGWLGGLD